MAHLRRVLPSSRSARRRLGGEVVTYPNPNVGTITGVTVLTDAERSLQRIAAALERIADVLDDVTDRGRVNVSTVTREARP